MMTMPDPTLDNPGRRKRLAKFAQMALTTFAIFNGLALSYALFHTMSDHAFPIRLILSVLGGVTIAAFIGFGWKILLAGAVEGDRDWQTLTVGGALGLLGIALSAWSIASLIGGDEALHAHRMATLGSLASQAARIERNGALDRAATDAVASAAIEVRQMAETEAVVGSISGIGPGRQEWTRALEAYSVSLAEAVEGMRAMGEERAQRLAMFELTLVEARLAALADNAERYEEQALKAGGLLSEADRVMAHPRVSTLGAGMMTEEARGEIAEVKTRLIRFATTAETRWERGAIPFPRVLSKHVATAEHADAVPGAWLIGVAFELLPLLVLLAILIRPRDPMRVAGEPRYPSAPEIWTAPPVNDDEAPPRREVG